MATTLIVDGYNAINAIPETRDILLKGELESARTKITAICKEYTRSSGYITDVKVVFDGDDKYRYLDKMAVDRANEQIFSRTGMGDDKIIETVKRCSSFSRVIIASNDNYVRNMSRGYGASILNVEELIKTKKRGSKRVEKAETKRIPKRVEQEITQQYLEELGLE